MKPNKKPFGNSSGWNNSNAGVAKPMSATPARNTPFPRANAVSATPAKTQITHEMIAKRAFEIHASGNGGSQDENWHRAERELRGSR